MAVSVQRDRSRGGVAKLLDGRIAAAEVLEELRKIVPTLAKIPRLAIVHFDDPKAPSAFIREKARAAQRVGVEVRLYPMPATISSRVLSERLNEIAHGAHADGIVVQLPLPASLDRHRQGILRIIPEDRDVDCLTERWLGRMQTGRTTLQFRYGSATLTPPVAAAIAHFLDAEGIVVSGKRVVIIGWGDLVGKPCAAWFLHHGATVTVARSTERNLADLTAQADIIVSGVGKPGLITGSMIREGAIVFDAGVSEAQGSIVGDVAVESVAGRASLLTPVPGGIGPLAVAMLLRNLVGLTAARSGHR